MIRGDRRSPAAETSAPDAACAALTRRPKRSSVRVADPRVSAKSGRKKLGAEGSVQEPAAVNTSAGSPCAVKSSAAAPGPSGA